MVIKRVALAWAILALTGCSSSMATSAPTTLMASPDPAQSGTPTVTIGGDWLIWEQAELGVRFPYPAGYVAVGCGPALTKASGVDRELHVGNRITFHVEASDQNDIEVASQAFIQSKLRTDTTFQVTGIQMVEVGGEDGVKVAYRSGGTARFAESTFIIHNDMFYRLHFSAGDFCDLPLQGITEGQVFERILAELQFID